MKSMFFYSEEAKKYFENNRISRKAKLDNGKIKDYTFMVSDYLLTESPNDVIKRVFKDSAFIDDIKFVGYGAVYEINGVKQ